MLLLALVVGFGIAVAPRQLVAVDVMRDRNALYRQLPGGVVENSYAVRLMNKAERARRYVFSVESATGVYLDDAGVAHGVAAGSVSTLPLRLRAPAGTFSGSRPVTVRVTALDDARVSATVEARFLMPSKAGT